MKLRHAMNLCYLPRFGQTLAKWEGSPQVKQQPCTVSPVAETNVMPSLSAFRPLLPRPPPLRLEDADADACLPPPRLPRPRPLGTTFSSSSSHLHSNKKGVGMMQGTYKPTKTKTPSEKQKAEKEWHTRRSRIQHFDIYRISSPC